MCNFSDCFHKTTAAFTILGGVKMNFAETFQKPISAPRWNFSYFLKESPKKNPPPFFQKKTCFDSFRGENKNFKVFEKSRFSFPPVNEGVTNAHLVCNKYFSSSISAPEV